jgi:acetoin utilization deacetylase AcuC-like enzyme
MTTPENAASRPPGLIVDPVFLEHDSGRGHPESPLRLETLYKRLETSSVTGRFVSLEYRPAAPSDLALAHDEGYIATVERFCRERGGRIEADTHVGRRSFEVAAKAAGAALAATDAVLTGEVPRAFVAARPPGHHAVRDAAMGFCLFNNIAVAAAHALARHDLDRVLIVDWDVHHGNGTQDIFYSSERVGFFSSHRHPFYPGSGLEEETGIGAGVGTKFNLPIAFGTERKEFLSRFESKLHDAVRKTQPQLILISAGFDAHHADPIGSLGLETEDFATLTRMLVDAANATCGGRIVSLLEGGYNVERLADCVEAHLRGLAQTT